MRTYRQPVRHTWRKTHTYRALVAYAPGWELMRGMAPVIEAVWPVWQAEQGRGRAA